MHTVPFSAAMSTMQRPSVLLVVLITLATVVANAEQQAAVQEQATLQQPVQQAATVAMATNTSQPVYNIDALFMCPDDAIPAPQHAPRPLPRLVIEQVLDTTKSRRPTDVTLVTQLSFERLYMLEGQCDVWNGVISAAVYIPIVSGRAVTVELNSNQDPQLADLALVKRKFQEFHGMAEAKGLCKLDLLLVSQEVESVFLSGLYPVNAMRNRGLANARTDIVLLLDVDFWPAAELSELAHLPGKYTSLLAATEARNAIVLPAFETRDSGDIGVEVAREAVLEGKDAAVAMFWDGRIKPFHGDRYSAGHRATDFKKWLTATRPYSIVYEQGFEPYVLVHRKLVPWFDERFVGYRKNKVVHLLHLAQMGLQFVVHPRAFAVHAPHPRARTWTVTHKTGLWDQLADIYDDVREGLAANNYIPVARYSCGAHRLGPLLSTGAVAQA